MSINAYAEKVIEDQGVKENNYCDKYKSFLSFFFENAKTHACIAGQKASLAANPEFCAKYSIISGKEDHEIFQVCEDGFDQAEKLAKSVNDSSRNNKEYKDVNIETSKNSPKAQNK